MKISHGTRVKVIDPRNGYGYATTKVLESLSRLGHEVNPNDASADVEIWFDQPQHWNFSDGPYRIGYHPWESTMLRDDWADIMNQCDEIWTPSPLIADWYVRYAGIKVPVFVYEHGVDPEWKPVNRKVDGLFKFLHVGAEASRKGGKETMRAFREEFVNNNDVELNMKIISQGWQIGALNKVKYINKALPIEQLIQLFHDCHVFVYPSYGEGFGLNPLQAMATGMPTITVPGWAPYARFLDPDLSVDSKLIKTPYPRFHPGMMLEPKFSDIKSAMRFAYDHYDLVQSRAHAAVEELTTYYNWDRLTKQAFDDLAHRL